MNGINQNHSIMNMTSSYMPANTLDFNKILRQLSQHAWLILGISICTFIMAFLYVLTLKPSYQSTTLIQIRSQPQNSGNMLSKFGYTPANSESVADTLVALMRSRYVLEPVIQRNNLNVIASPNFYPFIGAWLANKYHGNDLAKSFFGLSSYAWGGEKIQINTFSVPANYIGQSFRLVTEENNTYKLYNSEGTLVLSGTVGQQAASYDNRILLDISLLKAHPKTEFHIVYQSPTFLANNLAHKLRIINVMGNDPMQSTGVYQLQFTDSNPKFAEQMLNDIVKIGIENNIQQQAQETQKTLQFLTQKLPELKQDLEKAEDALNQYHSKNATISMMMVSQLLAQQLHSTNQSLQQLKSYKEELLQTYTPNHPIVIAVEHKQMELQRQLDSIINQVRNFPGANQEEINLQREVKIKNSMYISLLNNQQQLQISKAGVLSDIISLTNATLAEQLPLHRVLIVIAGFLLGAFFSSIAIILKALLNKTIENANQLEDELQIPVLSVLPYSRKQKQLENAQQSGLDSFGTALFPPLILAKQEPNDLAIESIRSLRVSLLMTANSSSNRIIALMGSLSNAGKSFISLNLAQIFADSGKRTLLIDADVRKGTLHRLLSKPKSNGLSEFLEEKCNFEEIIRPIHENLSFISCGTHSAHPTELFQNTRFQQLIAKMEQKFDQIIIDTAPVVPVTDSILVAQHCNVKLFVVSAGKDTMDDVKQAIKKIHTHGIELNGIILNHIKPLNTYGSYRIKRHTSEKLEGFAL